MKASAVSDALFAQPAVISKRRVRNSSYIFDDGEKNITFKQLREKPKSTQLRVLARISPNVSKAVSNITSFVNSGWGLAGDDDAKAEIQAWIDEMGEKGINIDQLINENIFDLYVIGYMGMQNIGNPKKEIIAIRNIHPEHLGFETLDDDHYKSYPAVGYYKDKKSLIKTTSNFVPLQSIIHSEPNFYYAALSTTSGSLKGISIIESVIDLAISEGEKEKMMTEYLRGKIFPNEIFALQIQGYIELFKASLLNKEEFTAIVEKAKETLDKFNGEADASQALTISMPVEKVVAGSLDVNLQGLQNINDSHDVNFPKALKMPQSLLGARNVRVALNDTHGIHEVLMLYKLVLQLRNIIRPGYNKLFKAKLKEKGRDGKCTLEFSDQDPEFKALMNAALKALSEVAKLHSDMGTFDVDELRKAFTEGHLDFTKFPAERPEKESESKEGEETDAESNTQRTDPAV